MHSDGELDESKFVPDYNEELTPSQSSHGEPASTNTSSLCSMDLMILDEVRCSSDEVEDPKEPVNQLCADQTKEAVLDKPLPTRQLGSCLPLPSVSDKPEWSCQASCLQGPSPTVLGRQL